MIINMTKDQLLEALNEKVEEARKYDADRLAEHRKMEGALLESTRQEIRNLLDLDVGSAAPACPISMARKFEKAIHAVQVSNLKNYRMAQGGVHNDLFNLVLWSSAPEPKDLCA